MMGTGNLRIEVATLRKLLPLWMRTAGFVVDDSQIAATGMMWVDAGTLGFGSREIAGYFVSMLRGLTITDGCIAYKESDIKGTVLIRVWEGEEDE
jgi:hypothetical protein